MGQFGKPANVRYCFSKGFVVWEFENFSIRVLAE